MDICGSEAVFLPTEECDSCELFLSELQKVSDALSALDDKVDTKQDALTAGKNITIEKDETAGETVISSEDYTAGDGITIDDHVISADRNPDNTYTMEEVDGLVAGVSQKTYTKEEVDDLLGGLEHVRLQPVDELPAEGLSNYIYLLANPSGTRDMYVYADGAWVRLGSTDVDLTDYSMLSETMSSVSVSGTTFTATRADGTTFTFELSNSGVTAGTYGPGANVTGSHGATMAVPQITVDAKGRVTSAVNRTYTAQNTTYGAATTAANGLMTAAQVTKLNGISAGANKCAIYVGTATFSYSLQPAGSGKDGFFAVDFTSQLPANAAVVGLEGYDTSDGYVNVRSIIWNSRTTCTIGLFNNSDTEAISRTMTILFRFIALS